MMTFDLVLEACRQHGVLRVARRVADINLSGISTDSRHVKPGQGYLALRGDRFDGNDFAAAAVSAGACALILEHEQPELPVPQIIVSSGLQALGAIAATWRRRLTPALISVTGSNGKTTTTQMLASILSRACPDGAWFATRGNRNNDIGVPQMLLELTSAHQAVALEMGMNHVGEIAYLASLARPTVAVLTNAQREHQEFLASVEQTAIENGAAIEALPANGVAVIPADDDHVGVWQRQAGDRSVLLFGTAASADVRGRFSMVPGGTEVHVRTPQTAFTFFLHLTGDHNARNALAAAAGALAAGIDVDAIVRGLEAFSAVSGRGVRSTLAGGTLVIDDSYNANPDSVRAAVDLLATEPGVRILVLGDMGEVGTRGREFHQEVGAYAAARGIHHLLCLGDASRDAAQAFGSSGMHFDTFQDLVLTLKTHLPSGDVTTPTTVLVKGSRFMRMERVLAALRPQEDCSHA